MPAKPQVVISYTRGDGLDFVRRLRAWLKKKIAFSMTSSACTRQAI